MNRIRIGYEKGVRSLETEISEPHDGNFKKALDEVFALTRKHRPGGIIIGWVWLKCCGDCDGTGRGGTEETDWRCPTCNGKGEV